MRRLFRLGRSLILIVVLVILAGAAACFVNAGRMLVDPRALNTPAEADAIVVLSSGGIGRWLEAYDLWREQRAPRLIISPGYRDAAARELERRGVHVPTDAGIARDILVEQMRMPASAVEIIPGDLDNTAAEAAKIRELASARGWRRVIIVTSLPHTRRTAMAMRRALAPAGIDVQVRASRYDAFQPTAWWRSRASARWVMAELPKLLAYKLGMGE